MSPSPAGNPIADEILRKHQELSPPAQQAVGLSQIPAMTEANLSAMPAPPALAAGLAPPTPQIATTTLAKPSTARGFGPLPGSPEGNSAAELQRLQSSPSGIGGIHNPWARHGLQILDAVGSAFFPAISAGIPGTQLHHQGLVNRAAGNVARDQGAQAATDTQRLREAQAAEQESLPELHNTQTQLKTSQMETTAAQKEADRASREGIAQGRNETSEANTATRTAAQLRKAGWRENPETGEVEPIPEHELPEHEQITNSLKRAQSEAASARAELVRAQASNEPERMKLAQARVEHANRASDIAIQRLQLSNRQYEARFHGTEGGQALPGAMLNDTGAPVGTAFQQNVRPTGAERNKGDMAQSAHEQLGTLKDIVGRRPDIFGPIAGRKTDFTVWLGSQDPDAQRFRAARTIAADHLAGTFGGRSEAALKALDDAIGQFKSNPAAVQAGLDQLEKGNEVFRKAGAVRTVGSQAGNAAAAPSGGGAPPAVTTKEQYDKLPSGTIYMEDGKKYRKP